MEILDIIRNYRRKIVVHNYTPKYFSITELVHPEIWNSHKESSITFLDPRILITIDRIREYYNKSTLINTWNIGGSRKFSGLRPPHIDKYSKYSQHKFGRAIDFIIPDIDSAEIRKDIITNSDEKRYEYITAIESFNDMNWVHIDCRNYNKNKYGLFIFTGGNT